MAIAFVAGLVLCMQVANSEARLGWEVSASVLWAVEAAIFGTAVYAWRARVTLAGWMVGIGILGLVRLALTAGAAMALASMRGGEQMGAATGDTSALAPRMCAVLFALMVCYPVRRLLPLRSVRPRRPRRFSDSHAVKSATGEGMGADSELVIWTGSDEKIGVEERRGRAARNMLDRAHRRVEIEGEIELPVRVVLAQMPPELVNERAEKIGESQMMSVPLGAVLPQLKEARVAFSPSEVREWLPDSAKRAVNLAEGARDGEEEASVVLPLALVVTQLPEEALVLPAPSPPAWANVEQSERVVFART